jgi:hypothetical protein
MWLNPRHSVTLIVLFSDDALLSSQPDVLCDALLQVDMGATYSENSSPAVDSQLLPPPVRAYVRHLYAATTHLLLNDICSTISF